MKKLKKFKSLICSLNIVFIFLLNNTALYAQTTNQVTDSRLKDRLKETENQTTDNIEEKLALGDQVEQGGKSTKNYELRTTNCNNQGVNLDCCLMMNPEEIREVEDALGFVRMNLLPSKSKTCTTRKMEMRASESAGEESSISTTIVEKRGIEEDSFKITAGEEDVNQNISEKDISNCEQNITRITSQIEEVKKERLGYWDHIVAKLEQSRDSWNKVIEICAQGKQGKSNCWRKSAEESEASAEGLRQAGQIFSSGKKEVAKQLEKEAWSGYYLSDISTWLLKSEDILEKADQMQGEKRNFWRNLAEEYQVAIDYKRRALEVNIVEKSDERNSYSGLGDSMYLIANRKIKAFEARKAGKEALAIGYENTVEILQRAVKYLKQSLAIYSYSVGINTKRYGWYNAGISLQPQADYQVKACEAEEGGKALLAACYREAAVISEKAASQMKLAAEAHAAAQDAKDDCRYEQTTYNGIKDEEGFSWGWASRSLQFQADYQAKAFEAEEVGRLILATGYRKVAETFQHAADLWKLSAEAYATGKWDAGFRWHTAGRKLQYQAEYQAKVCEAEEEENSILAAHYRELAVKSEHAASQRTLAAQAYAADQRTPLEQISAAGKKSEGNSWYWTGQSFSSQVDYQEKMMKAQEEGKEILAASYRGAIEILQRAVEHCQQAVRAFALRNEEEGISWLNMGIFFHSKAEDQVRVAERTEKTRLQESELKKENSNEISLGVVGVGKSLNSEPLIKKQRIDNSIKGRALLIYCEKWLAETKLVTEPNQIISDYIMDVVKRGADRALVKAFEGHWSNIAKAHESGNNPLALAWIQVAEDIQCAIENSIKLFQIDRDKNQKLFEDWMDTVQAMQKIAEYRGHYIQAEEVSTAPEILSGQKKILEGLESIAQYHRKAAEACTLKNEQEHDCFKSAAKSMKESIKQLEGIVKILKKMIDAAAERQPEVSNCCRKILEQYKESAESHSRAAKAIASGHINAHGWLKKAGNSAEYSAKGLEEACVALEKGIKAKRVNQEELAALWFKTATWYEGSAEHHSRSAQAAISGNITDYQRFSASGDSGRLNAYNLGKTAEVKEQQLK